MESKINKIDSSREHGIMVFVQEDKWENKYFLHNKYSKGADKVVLNAGIGGIISYDKEKNSNGFFDLKNVTCVSTGSGEQVPDSGGGTPSGPAPAPAVKAPTSARSKAELIRSTALEMAMSFYAMCHGIGLVPKAKNSVDLMVEKVKDKADKFVDYIQFGGEAPVASSTDDLATPDGSSNDGSPKEPEGGDPGASKDDIPF